MQVINTLFFMVILISFCSFAARQQDGLKESIERGKKVYTNTCLACHQADGAGAAPMNPPLIKTKWVLGDKKQLIRIVLKGLKGGEIEIDGDSFHNPMPPLEAVLTDQQVADVLTYVRNSFGNKTSQVKATDVKAVRGAGK